MYGQNSFDNRIGEKLFSEAGTGREHENTTTAADLFSYYIPANKLEEGDIVRIKVYCTVVDSNGSDTLTPILNFGGTAIATGAALDVADSDIVYAWADVHVTAKGSSGTMTAIAEPPKLRTGVKVSEPLVSITVQNTLILTISPTSKVFAGIVYENISAAVVVFSCSRPVPASENNF